MKPLSQHSIHCSLLLSLQVPVPLQVSELLTAGIILFSHNTHYYVLGWRMDPVLKEIWPHYLVELTDI